MAEKNYEEMQALFVSKPVDQSKTLGELYEELQKKYIHLVHSYEGRQVFSKIALTFFKDNTRLGEKALKRINALELSQNAENIKQTVEFLDNPKYKNFLEWIESTPDLILQHCREGFKDLLMLYELNSIKKLLSDKRQLERELEGSKIMLKSLTSKFKKSRTKSINKNKKSLKKSKKSKKDKKKSKK
jgi:hypothetical protein